MSADTLEFMAKSKKEIVQIRLPVALAADAGLVAQALEMSTTAFVQLCVREGISRHMTRVQQRIERLAKGARQAPE